MKKLLLLLVLLVLALTSCAHREDSVYQAHVMANYAGSSSNIFSTIAAALAAAPEAANAPYRIYVGPGDYYEKLVIDKPHIHLIGAGRDQTRIYFDAYAGLERAPGVTWGTRDSATLTVRAADVHLSRLTLENSFDFLANDALVNDDPQKIRHSQAVALTIDKGSDKFFAQDIALLGYQDTLFVDAGRSWFDRSLIAGNVDFIFGAGNALFTDSEIRTRVRGSDQTPVGYVTAPSTQITQEYGFTFLRCQLTREAGVPDNSTYLGRPWHPTTQFADGRYADPNAIGKAVFIESMLDAHIAHAGWHSMGGTAKDGSRMEFMPEDARFFEAASYGPGAVHNASRRQVSAQDQPEYAPNKLMSDWLFPVDQGATGQNH
jgi:pectinesterase